MNITVGIWNEEVKRLMDEYREGGRDESHLYDCAEYERYGGVRYCRPVFGAVGAAADARAEMDKLRAVGGGGVQTCVPFLNRGIVQPNTA
jgi:hypothetical protein